MTSLKERHCKCVRGRFPLHVTENVIYESSAVVNKATKLSASVFLPKQETEAHAPACNQFRTIIYGKRRPTMTYNKIIRN